MKCVLSAQSEPLRPNSILRQIFVSVSAYFLSITEVMDRDAAHRFDENGNLIRLSRLNNLIHELAKEFGGLDPAVMPPAPA